MNKIFIILFLVIYNFFLLITPTFSEDNKIRIGLLVPLTGEDAEIGKQIIKATRLALNDINSSKIEIFPKDTNSDPNKTLKSAIELNQMGINLIIGPVFYENLIYLDEVKDVLFLSFTNKTLDLPKNVISTGINSISQLNTINKFLKENEINKTILLIPNLSYDQEIENGIKKSKIRNLKRYFYNIKPTELTKQIEEITNYETRKQNLFDEIARLENSDDSNKEDKIKNLEKKYTIGNVNFDAVIISDFDESLKSVITSLLYTDVSPKEKYFITLNQWFDESLLTETTSQPIYYPSINKKNMEQFEKKFTTEFNENPNHLSLLSYDLVGLIYYLSLKNTLSDLDKAFRNKNSFKGKIGIFDIEDNKINHRLNFYKIEDRILKEIF
ncbi:ABC transporter substrate-binding protein [Candidatus Pelagibacter sp. HIMB1321]|uniref:ABC transporter substrate-binding protein n=1 Tax=Candidatus Pelagibacter sp. HIMB1321 TaxID=1388755 RepID=UPI000A081215|nr:ABC transporter substrate-binding protein [Candidatus Pelagibacter sp. HIMB1321]SMF80496.1 amino acid/amide ABC transporter substrate-binding protein, HAAT family [Candidatus Pelagibacter sp. HIMB1321]